MKIKDLCLDDRPREKLYTNGAVSLSNSELIAILLRTGTGKNNAIEIAQMLLGSAGGTLRGLARMSVQKMAGSVKGIGKGKAVTVAAALELGKRYALESPDTGKRPVTSPEIVYRMMIPLMKGLQEEEAWVLFLNRANYLIFKKKISSGGLDSTTVDNRMIVRNALDLHAGNVILIHNHPSGNPRPGMNDIRVTSSLREALRQFDISLTDHVIIGDEMYYSFADEMAYSAG